MNLKDLLKKQKRAEKSSQAGIQNPVFYDNRMISFVLAKSILPRYDSQLCINTHYGKTTSFIYI